MIPTLCTDLRNLVTTKKIELYHKLGCYSVKDLLFHFPNNFLERNTDSIQMIDGKIGSYIVEIKSHNRNYYKSRAPYIINTICHDNNTMIKLIFFNASYGYLQKRFEVGKNVAISGKIVRKSLKAIPQIIHPDIAVDAENFDQISNIEAIYPSTKGLTSKEIREEILQILKDVNVEDWLTEDFLKNQKWPTWSEAMHTIHSCTDDIEKISIAKTRIAFDELLASQIHLSEIRDQYIVKRDYIPKISGEMVKTLISVLPFELTNAQSRVLNEIITDQKSLYTMRRLLQGDVGSGKTLVALCAALNTVESGKQVAFMVPTEILAKQHYRNIKALCENINVNISLLISNMKRSERNISEEKLKQKRCDIVIGTHALFQSKIEFSDLGLCIVDEQHKFGVQQRLELIKKSSNSDFLMMSATPIPRTIAMIGFGDLDLSYLDEKPKGRKEVATYVISDDNTASLIEKITHLPKEEKIYWICPAINESDVLDIANVTDRYKELKKYFNDKVDVIHGKLKAEEKDIVMEKFLSSKIKILVSTTVIEVGVDVKDASIMIIENCERFGLAQLHQLRGRVGRSSKESKCILIYSLMSKEIKRRLNAMKKYSDGFKLANEDLNIRGAGDIIGSNQTGVPLFKTCDLAKHHYLAPMAYNLFKNKEFIKEKINNLLLLYDHIDYKNWVLDIKEKVRLI